VCKKEQSGKNASFQDENEKGYARRNVGRCREQGVQSRDRRRELKGSERGSSGLGIASRIDKERAYAREKGRLFGRTIG